MQKTKRRSKTAHAELIQLAKNHMSEDAYPQCKQLKRPSQAIAISASVDWLSASVFTHAYCLPPNAHPQSLDVCTIHCIPLSKNACCAGGVVALLQQICPILHPAYDRRAEASNPAARKYTVSKSDCQDRSGTESRFHSAIITV